MNRFSPEEIRPAETAETIRPAETQADTARAELPPLREIGRVSNCADAVTRCDPEALGRLMDYDQGVKIGDQWVRGNCGLDSSRNLLALCGKKVSEEFITRYAIEQGLCAYSDRLPPASRGGTNPRNRAELNARFGVKLETIPQERLN